MNPVNQVGSRLAPKDAVVRLATAATLVALAGCGGSGTATPPPGASLTITGTAASGAAIGGAMVEAKCAAGSASVTSSADGHVFADRGGRPVALPGARHGRRRHGAAHRRGGLGQFGTSQHHAGN